MSYSLATLWYERHRYMPGVLAVGFSALLIALQCGLLLGLFSITSIPVDHTRAHLWVGAPQTLSVDLGRPMPESYLLRVASQPGVEKAEIYIQGFAYWGKPNGGSELCMVIGSRLESDSLGAVKELTPELRARLTEPGAIIVDESDIGRLGIKGIGDVAEIIGQRVRVVGLVKGLRSLAGPYVLASINTARPLLRLSQEQTTYVLARCRHKSDAPGVVAKLRDFTSMTAFTQDEFSLRTRMHWLTKTKAGIALGCAAALGLLVGAIVTSQTLYAATAASIREYAVLQALGIPRWRMALTVLAQSFWVGILGIAVAVPVVLLLTQGAEMVNAPLQLPSWLLALAVGVTMTMAMASGLAALRSLRLVEPATLLR
ncbi:MAG: FtsX-like permease family protein [Planctomycetota bacterium]|nr:MAG: FtsX-like permease family protein [Planctomycetota bacterium]